MFRAFSRPSSGGQWLQWQPLVLPSYRGDRPKAATAVIELLMMGGRTPETCWAVNKHQDNKLENCCIWLVIYLNSALMHGLTDLKSFKVLNCFPYIIKIGFIILQPLPVSRLGKTRKLRQSRCVTLLTSKSGTAQHDERVTTLPFSSG